MCIETCVSHKLFTKSVIIHVYAVGGFINYAKNVDLTNALG